MRVGHGTASKRPAVLTVLFFFLCQRFRPCSYGASSFWSCVGLLAGEAFQNQTLSSQPAPLSTLVLPFDQNDAVSHFFRHLDSPTMSGIEGLRDGGSRGREGGCDGEVMQLRHMAIGLISFKGSVELLVLTLTSRH